MLTTETMAKHNQEMEAQVREQLTKRYATELELLASTTGTAQVESKAALSPDQDRTFWSVMFADQILKGDQASFAVGQDYPIRPDQFENVTQLFRETSQLFDECKPRESKDTFTDALTHVLLLRNVPKSGKMRQTFPGFNPDPHFFFRALMQLSEEKAVKERAALLPNYGQASSFIQKFFNDSASLFHLGHWANREGVGEDMFHHVVDFMIRTDISLQYKKLCLLFCLAYQLCGSAAAWGKTPAGGSQFMNTNMFKKFWTVKHILAELCAKSEEAEKMRQDKAQLMAHLKKVYRKHILSNSSAMFHLPGGKSRKNNLARLLVRWFPLTHPPKQTNPLSARTSLVKAMSNLSSQEAMLIHNFWSYFNFDTTQPVHVTPTYLPVVVGNAYTVFSKQLYDAKLSPQEKQDQVVEDTLAMTLPIIVNARQLFDAKSEVPLCFNNDQKRGNLDVTALVQEYQKVKSSSGRWSTTIDVTVDEKTQWVTAKRKTVSVSSSVTSFSASTTTSLLSTTSSSSMTNPILTSQKPNTGPQ